MEPLDNVNVVAQELLITPEKLKGALPVPDRVGASVQAARMTIRRILRGEDHRLLVIVGPCSIHDPAAAIDYAGRLLKLRERVGDALFIVMRAYFEKPRTTVGWKGLINDPHLDDTFHIEEGIRIARRLLIDIAELGVPLSTEALDPITPQYLHDLIAWSAIGARTTESQTHREMASGLSSTVGFKNGTDGNLEVVINALQSVSKPHRFLGINQAGQVSIIHTRGNASAHVVLRGGQRGPNFDAASIAACEAALESAGLPRNIMVDCSHANSAKDHERQALVARDVAAQIVAGNLSIIGMMLESNLYAGQQKLLADRTALRYGVSVTDACIDWSTTERLLEELATMLGPVLARRQLHRAKVAA